MRATRSAPTAKTELLRQEYTTKVTGQDLYDLLGTLCHCDYSFDIYVDGETERASWATLISLEAQMNRSNDCSGQTGNGVLTQVYQDIDNHEITIAVINTWLAKATEDYDDENSETLIWTSMPLRDDGRDQYVKTLTSHDG